MRISISSYRVIYHSIRFPLPFQPAKWQQCIDSETCEQFSDHNNIKLRFFTLVCRALRYCLASGGLGCLPKRKKHTSSER